MSHTRTSQLQEIDMGLRSQEEVRGMEQVWNGVWNATATNVKIFLSPN